MGKRFWRLGDKEERYVHEAIERGFKGEFNRLLEESFAAKFGVTYAIGVNSGNSALHASLYAVGVQPGDEVIVPPLTFSSPALAVLALGATPVFADIDPQTYNISPESIEQRITPKTKAIIAVSLYGLPANFPRIKEIAKARNIFLIEDNAECVLGSIDGKLAGSFGDLSIFSFERSKHLTTGNGGMVVTSDERLATRVRKFSVLGYTTVTAKQGQFKISLDTVQHPDFKRHEMIGLNYRLPELCAAVAFAQLERVDELVNLRCEIAQLYSETIRGVSWLKPQFVPKGYRNTYWTYAIEVNFEEAKSNWNDFRKLYLENGGQRYYAAWSLSYLEPLFQNLNGNSTQRYKAGLCPVAERVQPRIIQLKTNFHSVAEGKQQAEALRKTIKALS